MISFQNARVEMKIMSFGSELYVNGVLEQVFGFLMFEVVSWKYHPCVHLQIVCILISKGF